MTKQETLKAVRALRDAFDQYDRILNNLILACEKNKKKAA
jgi:hypothetical protein